MSLPFCYKLRHLSKLYACLQSRYVHSQNSYIKDLLHAEQLPQTSLIIKGWLRSLLTHKNVTFLQVNDGSCISNLQVVMSQDVLKKMDLSYGCSIEVHGTLKESNGKQQNVELHADNVFVIGSCDAKMYPLKRNKHHSMEYLRENLHLRCRTNYGGALLRLRNRATQAFHNFFQENNFCQIQTPILTSNDCEGAGEVFKVEPLPMKSQNAETSTSDSESTNPKHFFGVPTFLTVSGQLHLEVMSGAIPRVYTISPTFRAEHSTGRHHLSEFYMVEGEIAFLTSLFELTQFIESLLKSVTKEILTSTEDMDFFLSRISPKGHIDVIESLLDKEYVRISYTEAVKILEKYNNEFDFKVKWGCDLQKEHEKRLVQECENSPVFLTDFPTSIKPFYARLNDDGLTAAAVDLLCPSVGEICGGSVREERLSILQEKLEHLRLTKSLNWYIDLRKFGTTPHGGFGIGFERYLQTLLGVNNIKDIVPFPRTVRNCKM